MINQPPVRFVFYHRVATRAPQDSEAAREELARCRAIIESLGWQNIDPHHDGGESPYHRTDQPEPTQETPIP
jgi:hypothetical protein